MPKPFPVLVHIEEIALGTVLRKLHETPGVISVDLQFGLGGQGAGKQQLQQAAQSKRGSSEEIVVKLLLQGPKHISEISAAVGGKKTRAYGVMTSLRKQQLAEPGQGRAVWQLTHKARAQLGNVKALPAPPAAAPAIKRGPADRAAPGSGNILLRSALDGGTKPPKELREIMGSKGMSAKSISGVLERAKKRGLIKKNGAGYELTAKGQKIEMGASANG
ncbi:hypothetical protein [Bradyrhizobium cytisi]|uniref:Uncharacterized protein n=1 Tax=Bradyrhizobium cytisi TaxID=515489 RepID=A0A5S4XDD1_9BRAD|nr:hypothetical protein [Bradyrhizobium cytisi]TYL87458.1 hypothetical protein FXB38_04900 [Bradyrhizobium cytisi]